MISVSVGIGKDNDARIATKDALSQAFSSLKDKRADCALVFASTQFNQNEILEALNNEIKGVPVIGTSSTSEISSEGLISLGSVVIVLFNSDQIKFSTGFGRDVDKNPRKAGIDSVSTVDLTVSDIVFFGNTLTSNSEKIIQGIREAVKDKATIVFAGSSGSKNIDDTYQYFNKTFFDNSVVSLGLSGVYKSALVCSHSFLPVGTLKPITKFKDNIIYEIDGRPAIELYKDYFGDDFNDIVRTGRLMNFASLYPLGIYEEGSVKPVLRMPLLIDISSGGISTGGTILDNTGIRLQISDNIQNNITAKDLAIQLMNKLNGKKPKFVLVISSALRRRMEGDLNDDEIREIQNIIGVDVALAGFSSFGEFCAGKGTNVKNHVNYGSLMLWVICELSMDNILS